MPDGCSILDDAEWNNDVDSTVYSCGTEHLEDNPENDHDQLYSDDFSSVKVISDFPAMQDS